MTDTALRGTDGRATQASEPLRFIGYSKDSCRTVEAPASDRGHDGFSAYTVLWDRLLTDDDGTKLRCCAAISDSCDYPESLRILLIPEDCDIGDEYDAGDPSRVRAVWWDKAAFHTRIRAAIAVSRTCNRILWQVENEMWVWEAPFIEDGHTTERRLLASVPEELSLPDSVSDGDGRVRIPAGGGLRFDTDRSLYAARIDGKEYCAYPDMIMPVTEMDDVCVLAFPYDAGKVDLFVPEWVRTLEKWPDRMEDDAVSIDAGTLLLPDGLETIGEASLCRFRGIDRLVIPASVTRVSKTYAGDVKELEIKGDPARVLNWDEDAFRGCGCEQEYRKMREGIQPV